jgi:hypothetical protein
MERCLGPARHWLASIAPTFAACAERLGFAPITRPSISLGSKPPDRVSSGDPMSRLPTSGEWREGSLGRTTADWPFDWVAEITAIDP